MNLCATALERPKLPSQLNYPTLLMNFPFSLDTAHANNPDMEKNLSRQIDYEIAFSQFLKLYHYLAKENLIYVLPSEGNFQDQVYVANIGAYLHHLKDRSVILLSNYKSAPRIGEELVGKKFFSSMGYEVHETPFHWEGEADLKFLRSNLYIGGYGIRTDFEAHRWMEDYFEMEVLSIEMIDPRLYHLDCSIFPISESKILVNTTSLTREGLSALEKVAEIIPIPEEFKYDYLTNSKRVGNYLLADPVAEKPQTFFRKMCQEQGLEAVFFDLSEFWKSGADLSCMVMHLNQPGLYAQLTRNSD